MTRLHPLLMMLAGISALYSSSSSDSSNDKPQATLSDTEDKAIQWFQKEVKAMGSCLQLLPQQERKIFDQGITYQEDSKAVEESRTTYVDIFYRELAKRKKEPEFDRNTILEAVLKTTKALHSAPIKPTNLTSVRIYAYHQLTDQEKQSWRTEGFRANPQLAKAAAHKFSTIVAHQLAELKLIQKSEIASKTAELFVDKMALLQSSYGTSNANSSAMVQPKD